jgi:hypothetical protein
MGHITETTAPLRAEIREAFRHTHPSKSTPEWPIPTKMYVLAEEQVGKPIQEMWKNGRRRYVSGSMENIKNSMDTKARHERKPSA